MITCRSTYSRRANWGGRRSEPEISAGFAPRPGGEDPSSGGRETISSNNSAAVARPRNVTFGWSERRRSTELNDEDVAGELEDRTKSPRCLSAPRHRSDWRCSCTTSAASIASSPWHSNKRSARINILSICRYRCFIPPHWPNYVSMTDSRDTTFEMSSSSISHLRRLFTPIIGNYYRKLCNNLLFCTKLRGFVYLFSVRTIKIKNNCKSFYSALYVLFSVIVFYFSFNCTLLLQVGSWNYKCQILKDVNILVLHMEN